MKIIFVTFLNLKKIWRPTNEVRFLELGAEIILAIFDNITNKARVLRESSWNFDKSLILLKDFDGSLQVSKTWFIKASFWVRLHDLPLMAHNEYVEGLVGNSIGVVEEIDLDKWDRDMNLIALWDRDLPEFVAQTIWFDKQHMYYSQ